LFEDVEEIEENFWDYDKLRDQVCDEQLHSQEQEDDYDHKINLGQSSTSFSYFFVDREINYDYSHYLNQLNNFVDDDCKYDYILSVDHNKFFLTPTMQLPCDNSVEEEVYAPNHHTIYIENQQPLFGYDDIQDYMFSRFGQGFLLHDQRNFVAPDCHEMNYSQELLLKEQGGHLFLNEREFMQWKPSLLDQQVFDLSFEDPVAIALEFYFSKNLKFSNFIIPPTFESKYDFQNNFLWLLICLFYYLFTNCRDEIISVMELLSWLLWKFSFT